MNEDDGLYGYLAGQFADAHLLGQTDEDAAVAAVTAETKAAHVEVLRLGRRVLASPSLDWHRIADYANRSFKNEDEARRWLTRMLDLLETALMQT